MNKHWVLAIWIPDSSYWISDLCQWNPDSGFQSLVGSQAKLRPEGPKKNFGDWPPRLISRSGSGTEINILSINIQPQLDMTLRENHTLIERVAYG